MSSDGYFDDYLDEEALIQLDAIEAAYLSNAIGTQTTSSNHPSTSTTKPAPMMSKSPLKPVPKEDSFYDLTLDLEDEDYEKLDHFIQDSYAENAKPKLGPTRQTTLFGEVLPNVTQANKPSSGQTLHRTTSTPRNPFGSKSKKTKTWDQTAFAKSGQRKKGKGKLYEDEEEEEKVEFDQFPAPFVPPDEPPPPMKLQPDLLEVRHWHYPLNKPKRDYQYNIVKNSLFENTIISVPTGLGKTFIAGVIMLNYYRWFPDGKVVFVAPSKPLVAQQIDASHQSCGIPGSDAAEMTGEIPRAKREKLWREKRVFYMTPQTLMNDLVTQNCDVMDIILIVVDEAHKATGDYAYNQIVRWMMAKNPYFRLIALTATPGSNPEAVQNLVDGLHISHIEIRDENSLDLQTYLHEKKIEQHCIKMTPDILRIRDSLASLMDTYLRPLQAKGIMYPGQTAVKLHPYAARGKIPSLYPNQRGLIGHLSILGNLAQVMGYLLEGTVDMAFSYLKEVSQKDSDENASKNKQTQSKKLRDSDLFKQTLGYFEAHRTTPTGPFPPHPKMDMAIHLLVKYYGERLGDSDSDGGEGDSSESRTMVFVTHREAVDEIIEALDVHKPMIRASKFIGQGIDKHGKKGQAQKEQLEIIQKFQAGEFNVLVATCIGEEGLDIGEVDLIICYDTQKTPIRMLQRFGRTGRKRAGCVHLLLAEDREEFNLDKARASYKEVQKSICRGDDLELYADVKRLIPDYIKPECIEKKMDILPYKREEHSKVKRSPARPSTTNKRKRNDDMMRNIPPGASTNFVSVAELIIKKSKKKVVPEETTLEEAGEDDDLDRELDAGANSLLFGKKRAQSMTSAALKSHKEELIEHPIGKNKLKRASTETATKSKLKANRKKKYSQDDDEPKAKKTKETAGMGKRQIRTKQKEPSLTLSQQGRDDSLDRELEQGPLEVFGKTQKLTTPKIRASSTDPGPPVPRSQSPWLMDDDPIQQQLSPSENEKSEKSPHKKTEDQPTTFATQAGLHREMQDPDNSLAWLIDDDDDPDIVILSSSPIVPQNTDYEILGPNASDSYRLGIRHNPSLKSRAHLPDDDVLELSSDADAFPIPSRVISPEPKKSTSPLPRRSGSILPQTSPNTPAPYDTQPVRRQGRAAIKRHIISNDYSTDAEDMPPPVQRRLRRYEDTPELQPKKKRKVDKRLKPLTKQKRNPLLDYSAEHSGDEVSAGSSNSDDDVESDSDRHFIKDSPISQLPQSYDQTSAYRSGLMTQARGGGPAFNSGPVRNKPFGRMEPMVRRRVIDSSPPPEDDDYQFGSFVVDDADFLI